MLDKVKIYTKKILRAAEVFYWFAKRLDDAVNTFPSGGGHIDPPGDGKAASGDSK